MYEIYTTILRLFVLLFLLFIGGIGFTSSELNNTVLIVDGSGKSMHISSNDQLPHGNWKLILFQNAPNSIFENLVYDDGTTILVVSSDNTVIRNCTIKNPYSYAIFVEYSDNVLIENNSVIDGANDGIISYQNSNVILVNNSISNVVKNGVYAVGANTTVSNNVIRDVAGSGIYSTASADIVITHNQIYNVDWSPIALDESTQNGATVLNNTYNDEPYEYGDVTTIFSSSSGITDGEPVSSSINTSTPEDPTSLNGNSSSSTSQAPFNWLFSVLIFSVLIRRCRG